MKFELALRNTANKTAPERIINEIYRISYLHNPRIWIGIKWLCTYIAIRPGEMRRVQEKHMDLTHGILFVALFVDTMAFESRSEKRRPACRAVARSTAESEGWTPSELLKARSHTSLNALFMGVCGQGDTPGDIPGVVGGLAHCTQSVAKTIL